MVFWKEWMFEGCPEHQRTCPAIITPSLSSLWSHVYWWRAVKNYVKIYEKFKKKINKI